MSAAPDTSAGRYGPYGGRFVPETLIAALGGVLLGAGLAALVIHQRARQQGMRDRVEIEVRLRRTVVPVLERHPRRAVAT